MTPLEFPESFSMIQYESILLVIINKLKNSPFILLYQIEGEGIATVYTAMTDQAKYAQCKQDVRKLAFFKRDQYVSDIKKRTMLGNVMDYKNKPNWYVKK